MIRVTVWVEEQNVAKEAYGKGLAQYLAEALAVEDEVVCTAVYPEGGDMRLSEELLRNTDVLVWWAHCYHDQVPDSLALAIRQEVNAGMGAIFLHSAHPSKPFQALVGTGGALHWRESSDKELLWAVKPEHPILKGVANPLYLAEEETYFEPFDIPTPDELLQIGWFEGGEVFRSSVCYYRGKGRVFYFQPGHETFATYRNEEVLKLLKNAVKWAARRIEYQKPDSVWQEKRSTEIYF